MFQDVQDTILSEKNNKIYVVWSDFCYCLFVYTCTNLEEKMPNLTEAS